MTHHFPDGTSREILGWSNIDWNHLSCINSFLGSDGQQRSFMLAVESGIDLPTRIPLFRTTTPTFIPDESDIPTEALFTVDSLHKLYAIEKQKLIPAYKLREQAVTARSAELLAHPPLPKDLIIRYRIAETLIEETKP